MEIKKYLLSLVLVLAVASQALCYDFCVMNDIEQMLAYRILTDNTVAVAKIGQDGSSVYELFNYPKNLYGDVVIPPKVGFYKNGDIKYYSVVQIDNQCFQDCNNITSVRLPSTLKYIGSSAFVDCPAITGISIPDNVISVNSRAFAGCTSLKSVTIGKNVGYIAYDAFSGCDNLTSVAWGASNYPSPSYFNYTNSPFANMPSIQSFTFAYGVEKIPMNLCEGLSALKSVTIPATVKEIGASAFADCGALTSVKSYPNPAKVSLGENVFAGISDTNCNLHVKSEYLSAYKAADQWKEFPQIIGDLQLVGDIDGNSKVDATDVSILLEITLAGTSTYLPAADLNGDGDVDGGDVSILLEMVLSGE